MNYLKPYKVVFTRIGTQENWAGWRIAGYTEGIPDDISAQCRKSQTKNAEKAGYMYVKYHNEQIEEAREVYEFECLDDKVFSFTKQVFGDSDLGGRANMVASSLCIPLSENDEILNKPQILLSVDPKCFDECKLDAELLSKANSKTNYGLSEVQTIFAPKEYSCKYDFDVLSAIEEIFGNKKIYEDFIKCIYWNLTFKSATSIFIKSDNSLEKNIKIFLVAINSIIYSFRTKLSFRTFDFGDPNNQPTIVFSNTIPHGVRFFDIQTGNNNILTDTVVNKLNKQFMKYFPANVYDEKSKKFFDLLDKTLIEFGCKNSTEVIILETAFAMLQSKLEGNVEQSDKEIIKKIITFCNLPYGNDKIDSYIANLLDAVIIGGITLNDDIKNHIDKKLNTTKCPELIDVGNQYRARNLLNEPSDLAFSRLYKIKLSDPNYNKIIEYILLEPNGKLFVDEFYSSYYGPKSVSSSNKLLQYVDEVKYITYRVKIDNYIREMCSKWGNLIINKFFETNESLVDIINSYENKLLIIYPENRDTVSSIVRSVRYAFWDMFDFSSFAFDCAASYKKMYFSDMRNFPQQTLKCDLANKLIETFITATKQNSTTVRAFKNKIDESLLLNEKSIQHLICQFRKYCTDNCDKNNYIDFWLSLGDLDINSRFDYFFDNDITILTYPRRFDQQLNESKLLSDIYYLEAYRDGLDLYRKSKNSKSIAEIFDITKQYEYEIKKARKNELKQDKIREKKRANSGVSMNPYDVKPSKRSGGTTPKDINYTNGYADEKMDNSKPAGGKLPFGFKKPFKHK